MTRPINAPTHIGRIGMRSGIFSLLTLALASSLLSCSIADNAPRNVMFVNFDHERARSAFARFEAACEAIGIQRRHNVSLEFVGVNVTDPAALHAAMKAGLERNPVAIVAPTSPVLMEAVRLTETTPIVFFTHQDPVDLKLTPSLVRRPHNFAGISFNLGIEAKMLELLMETVPGARRIGYVVDRDEARRANNREFLTESARKHGIQWKVLAIQSVSDLYDEIRGAGPVDAWFVTKASVLDEHRMEFISVLMATHKPAIYPSQQEVEAGAPIAYEAVFDDPYGSLARQLDRVLSGVTPGEIPIERPKRFRLSVNVDAARAAGMNVSSGLLSRADRIR